MSEKSLILVSSDEPNSQLGIWRLLNFAPAMLVNTAPERQLDLESTLMKIGPIKMQLLDDDSFIADADPVTKTIRLSRNFLECLWCVAYAYLAFRRTIESLTPFTQGPVRIEFTSSFNQEIQTATVALRRALQSSMPETTDLDFGGIPTPVFPGVIRPDSPLVEKASEMTLAALGFTLLHEFFHIILQHSPHDGDFPWSIEQENDADTEAVQWILGAVPNNNTLAIAKRAWGVVIPTSFFVGRRLWASLEGGRKKPIEKQTHPQPYERIDRVIKHEVVQSNPILIETMTSLACAALLPQLNLVGLSLKQDSFAGYESLYEYILNSLSELFVS